MATVEQTLPTLVRQIGERKKAAPTKVAYIPSRFPKLSETFILYEILALEQQ